MILSMGIIGFIDNYIAMIAQDIGLWQFQIMRMCIAVPLLWGVSFLIPLNLRPKRIWAVVLRNGCIALGMIFYFGALAFMPMAQALAGLFTSPIFILLMTVIFLRESVGPARIGAVALGFVGIILVLGLDVGALGWISVLPVFGGLFYAMGSLLTRHICAEETTGAMLWVMFVMQALFGTIALAVLAVLQPVVPDGAGGFIVRGWVTPSDLALWLVLLQAVGSLIGVGFLIRAYLTAEASYVAIFEYSIFFFGPIFAWVLFDQTITWVQALGVACVVMAGIIIALRSFKAEGT
jgi:drug/metabolite transporter (DMT)-like permease